MTVSGSVLFVYFGFRKHYEELQDGLNSHDPKTLTLQEAAWIRLLCGYLLADLDYLALQLQHEEGDYEHTERRHTQVEPSRIILAEHYRMLQGILNSHTPETLTPEEAAQIREVCEFLRLDLAYVGGLPRYPDKGYED